MSLERESTIAICLVTCGIGCPCGKVRVVIGLSALQVGGRAQVILTSMDLKRLV